MRGIRHVTQLTITAVAAAVLVTVLSGPLLAQSQTAVPAGHDIGLEQPQTQPQAVTVTQTQTENAETPSDTKSGSTDVPPEPVPEIYFPPTQPPVWDAPVTVAMREQFNHNQSAPFDGGGRRLNSHTDSATFNTSNGNSYPTLRMSGFLQVDTGWIAQDDENIAAIGDVTPSTGLRRVRLRVDGNVQEATSYVIDLDFAASGHPSFRNVGLTFHDVPTLQNVEVGLLKTPFGLDSLTSGRELLLMERQSPFALSPFRQVMIGARGTSEDRQLNWGASLFRMPTNSYGVYEGGNGGIAMAGRLVGTPVYENDGRVVLHFGGGYSVGSPGDGVVRYRIQPGFFSRDPGTDGDDPGTVPVFLDTGEISADLFNLFNVELGMNVGAFHFAAEMRWATVRQDVGQDLSFPGFYCQASYVLTGENHGYIRQRGVFTRVIPRRPFERGKGSGFGAWEVVLGFATLDLNDGNINGGRSLEYAVGLNWYLTDNARLQFNILPATLDKDGFGESSLTVTALRAQIEF